MMVDYKSIKESFELDGAFQLKRLYYPDHIHEIGHLRIKSWKNEHGVDPQFFSQDYWLEHFDETAVHWAIMLGDRVVACSRLTIHQSLDEAPYSDILLGLNLPQMLPPISCINRLVVDPSYRGNGFSKILDVARIVTAIEEKVNYIIAEPQDDRILPLTKLGFQKISDIDRIPEIPDRHFSLMLLNLNVYHNEK